MKSLIRLLVLGLVAASALPLYAQDAPAITIPVESDDPFATVNSAAWSPDGTQVLASVGDGTVRVWDAATGDEVLGLDVAGRAWWNADGDGVITHDIIDDEAVLWRVADGSRAFTVTHTVPLDLPSPDRQLLATVDGTTVTVRDAATGEALHTLTDLPLNYYWLDGSTLAAVDEGSYQLWDAADGSMQANVNMEGFIADGSVERLLTIEQGPQVTRLRLYDTERGIGTRAYRINGAVAQARLAPADNTLYVAAQTSPESGMQFILWDITESDLFTLPLSDDQPRTLVNFAPNQDGSRIITISSAFDSETLIIETGSEQAVVWDTATGERLLEVNEADLFGRVWSPDEMQVVLWSDTSGTLWDLSSGELVLRFGDETFVRGAAFDADGGRLLVWGDDRVQIFALD